MLNLFRRVVLPTRVLLNTVLPLAQPITRFSRPSFCSANSQQVLLDEVQTKVFQVLKSAAKCRQDKLTRKATFEELGFDSLDSVELVVAMEEYFKVDLPNEEAEKINNVDAAVNTFYRILNQKKAK